MPGVAGVVAGAAVGVEVATGVAAVGEETGAVGV